LERELVIQPALAAQEQSFEASCPPNSAELTGNFLVLASTYEENKTLLPEIPANLCVY
jgi:hypothetical protein